MLNSLQPDRPVLRDLPLEARRALWLRPFLQSYACVFVCYAAMYLIRKNYNVAQNDLIETYGLTLTQLGMIGLCFSITYGIGKTALSYFADGKNTKQFLPLMLILSSLVMLVFAASLGSSGGHVAMMAACYALSGFFQSCGGPCSYATVTKWTPRRLRGSYLAGWNVSHNLGGALAAGLALLGANVFFDGHVVGMFVVPAGVALVIGLVGWHVGNDSPEAYGLGTVEELFDEPVSTEDQAVQTQSLSKWQIFHRYLLSNPVVWLICVANIFVYLLRIGVDQWATVYSYQVLALPKSVAIQGFTLFEAGAIIGTLSLGFLSDWIKGRRALLGCLALVIIAVALRVYQTADSPVVYLCAMTVLGCLVFGVQLMLGVAIVSVVPKNASGVADGLKGTTAYLLGDSMAKIGLGRIADGHPLLGLTGWEGTFTVLYASALICFVLLAMVAVAEEKAIRRRQQCSKPT